MLLSIISLRLVAIGLMDNKKRELVMPAHDNVEVPIIDKMTAQVLSVVGDIANVMDETTFETFDLKIPEELKLKVKKKVQSYLKMMQKNIPKV